MGNANLNLLLVEDDNALAEAVLSYLAQEGYHCERAATFMQAEDKLLFTTYALAIVDITLPGGTGLDLIRLLKKQKTDTALIIVSAKNSIDDKITGLQIGADDYLTKPFHLAELNARIKALLRRHSSTTPELIQFHEITIEPALQRVLVNNTEVVLTRKEYELLLFFIRNKNRTLTKEAILAHLWGDMNQDLTTADFIYTHIKNLRKKLSQSGCADYVQSKYGLGYKLAE